MLLNQLTAAATLFQAWATEQLVAYVPAWDKVGMRVEGDATAFALPFLQDLPILREWIGDKIVKDLTEQRVVVVPKDWESTIGIKVRDLESNLLGNYRPMIQTYPVMAMVDRENQFWSMFNTMFATNGYDNVPFLGTTHPVDGGTQSNLIDTGANANAKLTPAAYAIAVGLLRAQSTFNLRKVPMTSWTLVVSSDLEAMARTIVEAQVVSATTNIWAGTANLIVRPELTALHWYIVNTTLPLRPAGLAIRRHLGSTEPVFVPAEGLTDTTRFMRNEALFSVECSHIAFLGLPQLIVGSTGSGLAI